MEQQMKAWKLKLVAVCAAIACALAAQAQVTGEAIRSIAEKSKGVSITATIVYSIVADGDSTSEESVSPGVVISPDGLTVVMNASVDPGSLIAEIPGVTTKVTSVTLHLAGGTDVPAKVVLRDPEKGIAFLRPVKPLATPAAALNFAEAGKVGLGDSLVLIGDLGNLGNHGPRALVERIIGVVEKPRTLYVLAISNTEILGNAAFSEKGDLIGIATVKIKKGKAKRSSNAYDNALLVVIPGADILEAVQQIPKGG
ncbi:MAG: serine protease [Armatimonadota bacterium]